MSERPGLIQRITRGVDAAVSLVSPEAGLRRAEQRMRLEFAQQNGRKFLNMGNYRGADRSTRGREWFNPTQSSADAALLPELKTLRDRSRDLARNHYAARGALRTITANEIRSGLRPRANIDASWAEISDTQARSAEETLNRLWREWQCYADYGQRLSFYAMQAVVRRTQLESGDTIVARRYKERYGSPLGLALEVIESDRLSNPQGQIMTPDGNQIRGGVVIEKSDGSERGYYIQNTHPGDYFQGPIDLNWTYVPRLDRQGHWLMRHVYAVERPGQSRGEPFFAPVLNLFAQLDDYVEAEIVAAQAAACFSMFITKDNPSSAVSSFQTMTNVKGEAQTLNYLEPGVIEYLNPGEQATAFSPNRPGSNFEVFVKNVIGFIGAGLGLPPQLIMQNFENMNYSQLRGALVQAWCVFTSDQDFLIEQFCQPVWEEFVHECWLRGLVDLPGYEEWPAAYTQAIWVRPGREAVDALKDAQADAVRVRNGTASYADVLGIEGKDFGEHMAQLKREKDLMDKLGLDFSSATVDPAGMTKAAGGNEGSGPNQND